MPGVAGFRRILAHRFDLWSGRHGDSPLLAARPYVQLRLTFPLFKELLHLKHSLYKRAALCCLTLLSLACAAWLQVNPSLSWTNGGTSVSGPVAVTVSSCQFVDYAATNTSASTPYYIEFFNAQASSVVLGVTAPSWWMVVPPGPSGTVEHFTQAKFYQYGLVVAFVTSPGGSTAAPSNTCYASVGAK